MLGWAREYLSGPAPLVTFAVLAGLAVLGHRVLARRAGWSRWATAGLLLTLAAIAAVTLPPAPGWPTRGPSWSAGPDCARVLFDPGLTWAGLTSGSRGERLANTVMFLPLGFFAVLAVRRALPAVLVAALLLPFAVEGAQAVADAGRVCTGSDWATNALGALLGGFAGWLRVRATPRDAGAGRPAE